MKQLILILAMTMATVGMSQANTETEPSPIAHTTQNKDTLYVVADMYPVFVEIWQDPMNIKDKPVIIPVMNINVLRASLVGRKD